MNCISAAGCRYDIFLVNPILFANVYNVKSICDILNNQQMKVIDRLII